MKYLTFSSKKIVPEESLTITWNNISAPCILRLQSNVELEANSYELTQTAGTVEVTIPDSCKYITFELLKGDKSLEACTLVQDFNVYVFHDGAYRLGAQFVYRDGNWV